MKKQLTDFVRSLGGDTAYSGNEGVMYIDTKKMSIHKDIVLDTIKNNFGGNLPFSLSLHYKPIIK